MPPKAHKIQPVIPIEIEIQGRVIIIKPRNNFMGLGAIEGRGADFNAACDDFKTKLKAFNEARKLKSKGG